jgi:hypothetical protein
VSSSLRKKQILVFSSYEPLNIKTGFELRQAKFLAALETSIKNKK